MKKVHEGIPVIILMVGRCFMPPDKRGYFVFTVICPGCTMEITPPHVHMQVETAVIAGTFPTSTDGAPGTHGETVTGIQGIGVNTPMAADVAAATVGFEGVMHIPKGGIFTIGLKSITDAIGLFSAIPILDGKTDRMEGAMPNEHLSVAPRVTSGGIGISGSFPEVRNTQRILLSIFGSGDHSTTRTTRNPCQTGSGSDEESVHPGF